MSESVLFHNVTDTPHGFDDRRILHIKPKILKYSAVERAISSSSSILYTDYPFTPPVWSVILYLMPLYRSSGDLIFMTYQDAVMRPTQFETQLGVVRSMAQVNAADMSRVFRCSFIEIPPEICCQA